MIALVDLRGPFGESKGFRKAMRASGSFRKPKRRPSKEPESLGKPERTSKRLCRASQGKTDDRTV